MMMLMLMMMEYSRVQYSTVDVADGVDRVYNLYYVYVNVKYNK